MLCVSKRPAQRVLSLKTPDLGLRIANFAPRGSAPHPAGAGAPNPNCASAVLACTLYRVVGLPTMDDSWEVEDVVQYRTYYRKEQWLVKWKGYG